MLNFSNEAFSFHLTMMHWVINLYRIFVKCIIRGCWPYNSYLVITETDITLNPQLEIYQATNVLSGVATIFSPLQCLLLILPYKCIQCNHILEHIIYSCQPPLPDNYVNNMWCIISIQCVYTWLWVYLNCRQWIITHCRCHVVTVINIELSAQNIIWDMNERYWKTGFS